MSNTKRSKKLLSSESKENISELMNFKNIDDNPDIPIVKQKVCQKRNGRKTRPQDDCNILILDVDKSISIEENAKDYNNASAVETKSKRRGRRNKSDDIPLELKENIAEPQKKAAFKLKQVPSEDEMNAPVAVNELPKRTRKLLNKSDDQSIIYDASSKVVLPGLNEPDGPNRTSTFLISENATACKEIKPKRRGRRNKAEENSEAPEVLENADIFSLKRLSPNKRTKKAKKRKKQVIICDTSELLFPVSPGNDSDRRGTFVVTKKNDSSLCREENDLNAKQLKTRKGRKLKPVNSANEPAPLNHTALPGI